VDWKTGQSEEGDNVLQLGCYIAYTCHKWGCEPSDVEVHDINLALCQEGVNIFTAGQLQETKDRISDGIKEMKSLLRDPTNNTASEEDFPAVPDNGKCAYCNYKRLCDSSENEQESATSCMKE
jgi:CRISPR/Cas system-associated exonuclease Cas4 (RecB family)